MKTYDYVMEFNRKYTGTVYWRAKKHAALIDKNLNDGETVTFAFAAQNNTAHNHIFDTAVLALTNERIIIAQDRIIVGYRVNTITPDLYNDMQVFAGIIWGAIRIDTMKEVVDFSNISKKALPEIQKRITSFMIEMKKKYGKDKDKDSE